MVQISVLVARYSREVLLSMIRVVNTRLDNTLITSRFRMKLQI